jgi:GNAT superfamily N-acetyltransferase
MQSLEYQHLQMRLEGIGLDQDGRLIPLHENVGEFPCFIFFQGDDGERAQYFSASLPCEIQQEIKRQSFSLEFPDVKPLIDILNCQNIPSKSGYFKTYRFPEHFQSLKSELAKPFAREDPKVISFGFNGMADTVYAVEQNGAILSACISIREDEYCAESWVFTAPKHRRKGLAEAAVSLWAVEMLKMGKVPFYSYAMDNTPSARLVNKLGAIQIFEEVVLEEIKRFL